MDFVEFYQATSPRTLRYAYGLTGDLAQAQDLVQEAYARAWQRWRRLRGYDDAEAWLRLVVSRLAFDWWRHLRVRRNAALQAPAPVPPPSEETVLVVAALKTLPERHRQALALHYLMDMSVAQIATETGVSEGTVKSWLSRGRAGLATALREEVAQVKIPPADSAAELGRRRRRTRVIASVSAAGLAVIAVIVMVAGVFGRDRALPPPPTVTPTGSPMSFSPLQRVGGVTLPALDGGLGILDGRGFATMQTANSIQVAGVDLATGAKLWPPTTVPGVFGDGGRSWLVPGAVVIVESGTDQLPTRTFVVDAATGKLRWQRETPASADDVSYFPGVAVYADHKAGVTTGIDLATGAQRWQLEGLIKQVFGMVRPGDLDRPDFGTGTRPDASTSDVLFIADGKETVTEYAVSSGTPTGRTWHGIPPADRFLAYSGDVYVTSARELYRLHLADGRQTRLFAGEGLIDVAPCGAADICLIDAGTPDLQKVVVAITGDRVKWRVPVPRAFWLAPIGRSVRVAVGPNEASIVLDDNGRETLRLPGESRLQRLDAGNMLGYTLQEDTGSGWRYQLYGIPVATMRPVDLGTVVVTGGQVLGTDDVVLATVGSELVVYHIG